LYNTRQDKTIQSATVTKQHSNYKITISEMLHFDLLLEEVGRYFDTRSGRYQVISTWMGDCLRTNTRSRHNQQRGQLSLPFLRVT